MSDAPLPLPAFTSWPTFPFEGDLRVKKLADPVDEEPPRHGEDPSECSACRAPDSAYIWVSERWRVRALDRPTGLPMVLILESRSHLDMGDLTNLLAAELGVLTVRLERAVRSLDGVARVHVNRWGDGSAHLHVWFLARPSGRLQLRGTFLSLWDDILPRIPEFQWRENLALVAAWLADFGGEALAEPPHIDWQSPAELNIPSGAHTETAQPAAPVDDPVDASETSVLGSSVVAAETAELTRELPTAGALTKDGATTVAIPPGTDHSVSRGTGQSVSSSASSPSQSSSASPEPGKPVSHGPQQPVSRGTEQTVNLNEAGAGETIRIPTARTTGGETVNLADAAGGETARIASAGEGDVEPDASATMRFSTSGVTGSGSQTMVFPTGDAIAAARAESEDNADDDPRRPAASKS